MSNFIQQLKLKNPNVRGSHTNKVSRVQRHTLADAKAQIVKKLEANKAFFLGAVTDTVDKCYKETAAGYSFGIKYGNRYLANVFDQDAGGFTYLEGLTKEDMPSAFDHAVAIVTAGECDKSIQEAMAANLAMHAKKP